MRIFVHVHLLQWECQRGMAGCPCPVFDRSKRLHRIELAQVRKLLMREQDW